jgi:AcrR family transcriptional regulator
MSTQISALRRKPGEWATTPARRRKILDATLECFDQKGLAATSIEDVCSTAGLSVGSIYHHFTGKDDIFEHLVGEATGKYLRGLVDALEQGRTLEQSIRGLVRFHVGWVEERPALTRLMLRWGEAERSRPSGRNHYRESNSMIGAWLRKQVHAGTIRRMEPDLYSTLMMGPLMEYARQRSADLIVAPRQTLERGLAEGLIRVVSPQ